MRLALLSARSASRAALLGLLLAGGPALAQDAPARNGPIWNGRQHQPSRGDTQERLQDEAATPQADRERNQLRDLNALSRQLLPPGSALPAPAE